MGFLEIICTGNELLDGSVVDTNSQFVANALRPLGIKVSRVTVVPDDPSAIIQAVHEAASRSIFVIVSGGLGPTSDDLTLESVAASLGRKMKLSSSAKMNVLKRLRRLGRSTVNSGHHKQMMIPEGAVALKNLEGTAPGIRMQALNSVFYFLPGVPREFHFVFENEILGELKKERSRSDGLCEFLFVYKVFGWRESDLDELMKKAPITAAMTVGFRTHLPENHIKISVMAKNPKEAERKVRGVSRWLKSRLDFSLFAVNDEKFEEAFVNESLRSCKKVAVAESCTGGVISSMITSVSGASGILDRSFITYSNESKTELLGVKETTLKKWGAVSEETVCEMAEGALKNSHANLALAVTGIAGPKGGTREKPVGTVWIAASTGRQTRSRLLELPFHRELNQKYSAYAVMQLAREMMAG